MHWGFSARYLRAGAAIDTNLLLLLLVGRYDTGKLGRFRATQKYDGRIYLLLESALRQFRSHFTTINILTEVDNLPGRSARPSGRRCPGGCEI